MIFEIPCGIFTIVKINYPTINYKFVIPAVAAAVVVLLIAGILIYQYQKNNASQPTSQDETNRLVEEVGKLIELPQDEQPTVATITDITKLASQPFFQNAKNGDKVLIYSNAKKAILYDPLAKKVIDVAPINVGTGSAQLNNSVAPTATATPSPQPEVSKE